MVLALNVPLIVIPLYKGFSYEVIWSAFGAYMLSLIDYRGLHYRKIIIQSVTALLVFLAAHAGMYVAHSVLWSVVTMFGVGLTAGIIRNWKDYGTSIAVSIGFFFLLGLAAPARGEIARDIGLYLLTGCAWAILLTLISFPFQPSNPVRRSVANIWKANTDLLDLIVQKLVSNNTVALSEITEKELDVRKTIDQSRKLFLPIEETKKSKTQHYDSLLELRKTASLFAATVGSMHEELEVINTGALQVQQDLSFYKTLSAFAQASARVSIVMFTFRAADLALAKIRVQRCEAAIEIFSETLARLKGTKKESTALHHFADTLHQALHYFRQSLVQIEEKMNLTKSDYLENYRLTFHEFVSGLKPVALGGFFSELFRINWQQLNYALRVALGLALGIFLFKYYKIDHGYWIALTMMIVIQPYYGATLKKGIERIVGTVAGIVIGGVIMLLPLSHQTVTGLLLVDSFFVAYFLRNNYKVGVFFVTIMMVLLMQISQQGSLVLIGWRIVSTLIGAVLALIAGYAFWPVWEKERFPALLANALAQNKNYLLLLIRFIQKEVPSGESWQKYRRLAEGANNQVFTSAQRMVEEPRYLRKQAELSFALVGANIRITRELTSIALSIEKQKISRFQETFDTLPAQFTGAFDTMARSVSNLEFSHQAPDFKALKENLHNPMYDQTEQLQLIRTELEKVVFELEAMGVILGKINAPLSAIPHL